MLESTAAKYLPEEFVEASSTGGVFTIIAYAIMMVVTTFELSSCFGWDYFTVMELDTRDSDLMQINVDVDMYDIECRNLRVRMYAHSDIFEWGSRERLWAAREELEMRPIDKRGRPYGAAYRLKDFEDQGAPKEDSEEEHQKSVEKLLKEDGKQELDSDWASSHDGFHHSSFQHVIQAHDFTVINFFAGWCSHCQKFAPLWDNITQKIHGDPAAGTQPRLFKDRDGKERGVRLTRMNCVDFQKVCQEQGIDAFPTIRLYKGDGSFSLFEDRRNEDNIFRWLEKTVRMKSYGWDKDHETFERGCNVKGYVQVARLPGHMELFAGGGDQNLEAAMTNVSHLVKHLSFSDPGDGHYHVSRWPGLPHDVASHINPIDDQKFVSDESHEAWVHDLHIVSTISTRGQRAYQFTHNGRISKIPPQWVPQMRFYYDIEPFAIWVKVDQKRWYNFCTSLLAILGGFYTVMRIISRGSLSTFNALGKVFWQSVDSAGGRGGLTVD